MILAPPVTPATGVDATLARQGYAVIDAAGVAELLGSPLQALADWPAYWDDLPADAYLRDGGRYRRRRHGSFIVQGAQVTQAPHRPHWQPVEYNALHGGIERHFEPIDPALLAHPLWNRWVCMLAARATALKQRPADTVWYVEVHPFRIDTTDGIGRPTPEGAHRDGVDLVTVTLMGRHGIKGGETRVFAATGRQGERFTLTEPWGTLLLDDERVIHESTPIQPLQPGQPGHRDTLVLTFRTGSFQGPA
jgi:hypothetical protein